MDRLRGPAADDCGQPGGRCAGAQPRPLRIGRRASRLAARHGGRLPVCRPGDACRAHGRRLPDPCGMERSGSRGRALHLPQAVGNRRRGCSWQAGKQQAAPALTCFIFRFLRRPLIKLPFDLRNNLIVRNKICQEDMPQLVQMITNTIVTPPVQNLFIIMVC